MTDRMALLEAVAEAAREYRDAQNITALNTARDKMIAALAALDALPAEPAGETVEVYGAIRADPKGYVEGRVFRYGKDARRMSREGGSTENGPIVGVFFTARVPLPTIPTVAARVETCTASAEVEALRAERDDANAERNRVIEQYNQCQADYCTLRARVTRLEAGLEDVLGADNYTIAIRAAQNALGEKA
jgi:hypothetical protein